MVIESRERLEQIAREIEWPDEISQYIQNLQSDLYEDGKLEALTISLSEDYNELMDKYFGDNSNKTVWQVKQIAIKDNWPAEKKVQVGAIEGIEDMGLSVVTGLEAFSWGSVHLDAHYLRVTLDAAKFKERKYGGSEYYSLLDKRKNSLANDIVDEHSRLKGKPDDQWRREFGNYLKRLKEDALLWEKDPTGELFVNKIAQEIRDDPVGRKSADRNLPFTIGKVYGAEKARDLYIARYELLH